MKDYYKHNKYANNKPTLSFLGDKLKIESNKVVEHWDVNSNKLVYGAPIVAKHISFRLKNLKNSILKISSYTNIINIGWRKRGENKRGVKYMTKISITSGGKIIYGEYLSTDIKLLHHNYTFLPKKRLVNNSLKYIVTFNDAYQEIHSYRFKKTKNKDGYIRYKIIDEIVTTKLLNNYKNRYKQVFAATTLNSAMKAMYGTTEGVENPLSISTQWYTNDPYSLKITYKFNVELESLAIFIKEMNYPALFITDTILNHQKKDGYNFITDLKTPIYICSDGVHLVFMGRGKDGKIYKATNYGTINCTE